MKLLRMSVRKYQVINDLLENKKDINIASLSPSFANALGNKLDTRTLILGNILKAGNRIRINAQIVDVKTEEIYKTYQVDGKSENDLFFMADSLSGMIRNYIRGWDAFKYIKQLIEIDGLNPLFWHQLGFAYYKLFEYEDAVGSWEQIFKIHKKWETDYSDPYVYFFDG
jgi:tetratricopeptide (TPR) repeat protein